MKPGTYSKDKAYTGGVAEKGHAITKLSDLAFQTGLQAGMAMRERAQLEKDKQEFQTNSQTIMQQLLTAQAQLQQQVQGAQAPAMAPPAMGAPAPAGPAAGPEGAEQPDISQFLPKPPVTQG